MTKRKPMVRGRTPRVTKRELEQLAKRLQRSRRELRAATQLLEEARGDPNPEKKP